MAKRSLLRWFFEDRTTGQIVIGQAPNAVMWFVIATLALSFVLPVGRAATATRIAMFLALASWALAEIASGVNPWRRIVGAVTLTGIFVWLVILKR